MATPTLPALMNTEYASSIAQGCRTIAVPNGGNLQQALNKAKQGDLITLAPGATYTGNFTLPAAKGGSKTIRIQSAASLTPEGTRVSVADAASFPKIVTPNVSPAIQAAPGAANWRLTNVDVNSGTIAVNGGLIQLGTGNETNRNDFPHHIVIDRSYIHGSVANGGRRGVMFSGNYQAVIDSYLSDWKEVGADSQAIAGWTGFGPYKIVNNYAEGAGENVMFGGNDTAITNLTPSDIEIRGNSFFKPLTWKLGDPSYLGTEWRVKNLLELKHCQRVLITDNVFENCWTQNQTGNGIVFAVKNQSGGNPWAKTHDITFTRNTVRNVEEAMRMTGTDSEGNTVAGAHRILVSRNLFYDVTRLDSPILFLVLSGMHDLDIDHNTANHDGNIISLAGAAQIRFRFTNNIVVHNQYGIIGDDFGVGNSSINHYLPGAVIEKNVMVMNVEDLSAQYPVSNFFPASLAAVGFVNLTDNADLRLAPSSPYNNAALDGTDIGADIPTP